MKFLSSLITLMLVAQFMVAQADLIVQTTDYSQSGEQLKISFEIPFRTPALTYNIVKVTILANDTEIEVKSYSGNRENLKSGESYEILWDVLKDVNKLDNIQNVAVGLEYTKASAAIAAEEKTRVNNSRKTNNNIKRSKKAVDSYFFASTHGAYYFDSDYGGLTGRVGYKFGSISLAGSYTYIFADDLSAFGIDLNVWAFDVDANIYFLETPSIQPYGLLGLGILGATATDTFFGDSASESDFFASAGLGANIVLGTVGIVVEARQGFAFVEDEALGEFIARAGLRFMF